MEPGLSANGVRATYHPREGSPGGRHTWTYYFDDQGILVANWLKHGPGAGDYSFSRYYDPVVINGIRMPTRRSAWRSNAAGERLVPTTRISYTHTVFGDELPDDLFARPATRRAR